MGMAWCSPSNYGYVQKMAIADNPREVGRIVRGTATWDALYNVRTSVERAFSWPEGTTESPHRPRARTTKGAYPSSLRSHCLGRDDAGFHRFIVVSER